MASYQYCISNLSQIWYENWQSIIHNSNLDFGIINSERHDFQADDKFFLGTYAIKTFLS